MNDIKSAFRHLLKNPGFTAVAVLTLALGIGANTAIFSVVDRVLMRPLPVPQARQLVVLGQSEENGWINYYFSYPLFRDYAQHNNVFSHLAATTQLSVGLGTGETTDRQQALLVSGNYFSMLGIGAALGRTFTADEGVSMEDAPVIMISHGFWRRRFGADPTVIGRRVTLNGQPFTLIGVAPRDFVGTTRGTPVDLYVPVTMYGQLTAGHPGNSGPFTARDATWLNLMGRLRDGVTASEAGAALQLLSQQIHAATPLNTSTNLVVLPGAQGFVFGLNNTRLPLNLLWSATLLVLLITCANLANLQLARATARTRDFAVRLALGAGRSRLIRQLLSESLLLALVGGLLGLLVAGWVEHALWRFRPVNLSIETDAGVDLRELLFAFATSVLTGVLFGLAPALRSSHHQLASEMKGGGGGTHPRVSRWNLRSTLVVSQVALSLLVLVAAGLCVRSLQQLQKVDYGIEPSRVVLASFDLGVNNYDPPREREFYDQLLERARTLPGIEAASLSANTPLTGGGWRTSVGRIEGYQPRPDEDDHLIANVVTGDYFRTMGVRLISGRDFGPTDAAEARAMIVNEAFVRRYWPGQDAVGKRVYRPGPTGDRPFEVVGVVASTPYGSLSDAPEPVIYLPLELEPQAALTLSLRSGVGSATTMAQLRGLVKSLDANVAAFDVRTLAEKKDGSLAFQRMAATLLSGFGVLALLLAALGIYGVLAYSVSRRTREFGVRMALGAQIVDVLVHVMRQGLGLVAVGIALGLSGAFVTTRLLRRFLFEVQPLDSLTYSAATLVLAVVALIACWLPARRAARLDPMEALRSE